MKFLRLKTVISALFIIGIFLLINFTGFSKTIKNFFYSFSSPLQSFFWTTGNNVFNFGEGLLSSSNLEEENKLLKNKNKELLAELLFLREIENENNFLRNTMGLGIDKEFDLILTKIISKDISRDAILIDKGGRDNIKKNQPVITSQKLLLGKIGEVYENFSEVVLISNPEISFDAKISETDPEQSEGQGSPGDSDGGSYIFGVVKGKGRSEISFEFIPKEKELKQGDFIVSAALGGVFPEGILVGEIQEIKKSDTSPFQSAKIKPSFDIKSLDKLFIIENFNFLPERQ